MKNYLKIFTLIIIIFNLSTIKALPDSPYFLDFSKVLNQSKAGKGAQEILQKKLKSESAKFEKLGNELRKEEAELINQKKLITSEEYKKKVNSLRKKVAKIQTDKKNSVDAITKSRNKARTELFKKLNPIIKKYMEDNKIRVVLDKKAILLADNNLDITQKIIEILNKELKSLNLN
jgi:outer membrane protein